MKLLLIDDDSFLRDMYATKFREAGHTVFAAQSGQEALEILEKEEKFDAILLDMVMPAMTGLEFLEAINDRVSTIKCVVLSNQGEQSDIDAATAAGAVGYIVKAESIPSEVVTKVEAIMQQ